jgi:hypothetical protein
MQRAHLAQAERHIASGIRHTAKQVQIIADLDRGGHDAAVALQLLTTFIERAPLFAAMDTWDGKKKLGLLLIE